MKTRIFIVLWSCLFLAREASAQKKILIYGPSMSPGSPNEESLAVAAGHTVTVADGPTWSRLTKAQFAAFDAIVFGDPNCVTDPSPVAVANANKAVWSAVIKGPKILIGTDPIEHRFEGQAQRLIINGIGFAASGPGTGLYASLSCYYFAASSSTTVSFLSAIGTFKVLGQDGCPDSPSIVDTHHPAMVGLEDAGLSNWNCSMHEWFTSFPPLFTPLVTETSGSPASRPYIIATGCVTRPLTGLTITANTNCHTFNPHCSANIVLADGFETTELTTTVRPAQVVFLDLSTSFGNIVDAQTDPSGKALSVYTAGTMTLGGTTTTTATVNARICSHLFVDREQVFNYRGFNFHQSNVTDTAFTDSTTKDAAAIQSFFMAEGSFMADFILVGTKGGFLDTNGNGMLDTGEPTYSAHGVPIPLHSGGVSAATIFATMADDRVINPNVLLATVEKENGLISRSLLPPKSVLNWAMGCGAPTDFVKQIQCGAKTLVNRFGDTHAFGRAITYPFFFRASDGFRHSATARCDVHPLPAGCERVAFAVETAATYAQYRYTPFIQSLQNGGGVYLFERIWRQFGF